MLIDTHTHFYDEWLLPDAEAAISRALEAGVGKMVQADVDSRERDALWEINDRHPGVLYPMVGLYPCSVGADWKEEIDRMLPYREHPILNQFLKIIMLAYWQYRSSKEGVDGGSWKQKD